MAPRLTVIVAFALSAGAHWLALALPPASVSARPELDTVDIVPAPLPEIQEETDETPPQTKTEVAPEPDAHPEPEAANAPPVQRLAQARPEPRPVAESRNTDALRELAEKPQSDVEEAGAYAASVDGPGGPRLRIDWGDRAHAEAILRTTGMALVVLRGRGGAMEVADVVEQVAGRWTRLTFDSSRLGAFSNRIRIVDDVPAFTRARRDAGVRIGERLAVLVPAGVEQMFDDAIEREAARRGLGVGSVGAVGGAFAVRGGRLYFEIRAMREREAAQ